MCCNCAGGVDVKLLANLRENLLQQGIHLHLQVLGHLAQIGRIHHHTAHLQGGEHFDERHLDVMKQVLELVFREAWAAVPA